MIHLRRFHCAPVAIVIGCATFAASASGQDAGGQERTIAVFTSNDCVMPADQPGMWELPVESAGMRPIVGKPFSAVGRSVMTTTLATGNRIVRSNVTRYFRDARGRTRIEHEFSGVGPFSTDGKIVVISIQDPVSKKQVFLHPQERRADVLPLSESSLNTFAAPVPATQDVLVGLPPSHAALPCETKELPARVSLGEKVLNGLRVVGGRSEFEIPAGEVGNELPITITSEEWFSPELGVMVSSKRSDPLIGETVYGLEQVRRDPPEAALFVIPNGYAKREMTPGSLTEDKLLVMPAP